MNAQEAAKIVNSGVQNLSLSQFMEAYAALKNDESNAGLFQLVNGYAKARLSAYARSTEDSQSKLTMEDVGALRELAEEVGFDEKDNLTKDGQKALEIAKRVSKQLKDIATTNEQSENKKTQESTPLTPEQIKVLDEKGVLHNGTLESIAWFKDRDEAMKVLSDAGVEPEKTPEAPIVEINEDEVVENVNENNLGSVDISKNMQQLEMLSESLDPLDEKNETFADSRASLNVLDVYDEEGNKYDVRSELVEQAKLRTESEMLDTQKVTKEDYIERLKLNIDEAVVSIISGNTIDFSNYNGNREHLQNVLRSKIDVFTKAEENKPSKAHVRLESVLGFMSVESARIDSKIEKIEKAVGNLPIMQKFKAKIKKFDEKCEQKFGAKVWGYARFAALVTEKVSPALGMAAVAGFCGPLGIGVYGAYVLKTQVLPFTNKYMKQPKEQRTSFRKFCKENKKDTILAGLYAASATLSAGMAVYSAFSNLGVAAAGAASAGQTLDTAAKASLLTRHVGVAKMTLSGAAMLTRSATSVYEAQKAGDKKERNRRLLIGLGSVLTFGAGIWARDMLGNWSGAEKEDASTTSTPTITKPVVGELVDKDGDNISDFIDRDAGDGSANVQESVADAVTTYDDFYHGSEVADKSKESVIRLLTNSEVSRSTAELKAEMMIYRVSRMEDIQAAFPNASDAQIAHAILLRAADVRKGDADELLRSLLGDGNCSNLTTEQQITEIHKGLTGYNYGQNSELPYGRNLDEKYVGLQTRSRFLVDDCSSERLIDGVEEKTKVEEVKVEEVKVEEVKVEEVKVEEVKVEEVKEEQEPKEVPHTNPKSFKVGKPFEGQDTLTGARDQIYRLAEIGVFQHDDGKFRYVDYDQQYKMLLKMDGYTAEKAQEIVNNRIAVEQKELENLKTRSK